MINLGGSTRAILTLSAIALPVSGLAAQHVQFGLQAELSSARLRGLSSGGSVQTTMIGGRGSVSFGPARLSAVLREGQLSTGRPTPAPQLIDGSLFAQVHLLPQLTVGLGLQGRAYVTDTPTVKRIWASGGVHLELPLAGPTVRTYIGVWRSVATRTVDALSHAAGGEVGIALGPAEGWGVRLATRFDDVVFTGGHRERLVALTLAAGIGP